MGLRLGRGPSRRAHRPLPAVAAQREIYRDVRRLTVEAGRGLPGVFHPEEVEARRDPNTQVGRNPKPRFDNYDLTMDRRPAFEAEGANPSRPAYRRGHQLVHDLVRGSRR